MLIFIWNCYYAWIMYPTLLSSNLVKLKNLISLWHWFDSWCFYRKSYLFLAMIELSMIFYCKCWIFKHFTKVGLEIFTIYMKSFDVSYKYKQYTNKDEHMSAYSLICKALTYCFIVSVLNIPCIIISKLLEFVPHVHILQGYQHGTVITSARIEILNFLKP